MKTDRVCPAENDDNWHDEMCDDSTIHFALMWMKFLDAVTSVEPQQFLQEFHWWLH